MLAQTVGLLSSPALVDFKVGKENSFVHLETYRIYKFSRHQSRCSKIGAVHGDAW